jgi:hypothetical protein
MTALETECRVLDELREALARQRAGVAADDVEGLDAATHAVSRALLTLEEARRRREHLVAAMTGTAGGSLTAVSDAIGPSLTLSHMREMLRGSAEAVIRDLALTQSVLRGALRAGDKYLQSMLTTSSGPRPAYAPAGTASMSPARGVLLNRNA